MHLKDRINAFIKLGIFLREISDNSGTQTPLDGLNEVETILRKAEAENGWFTRENVLFSLKSWGKALTAENLQRWLSNYQIVGTTPKTIAIIMAGNIPLVGFHDFLSVLVTGNKALVKLSSNDRTLLPFLAQHLIINEPSFANCIAFTENRLQNFDAVIATGSDNTARYFNYYFGKYPHIIRKNRNAVAVLTGNESQNELELLANDIFRYFGLGCRNVSKLYIPKEYDFERFFKAMFTWKEIIHNNKYINNYDYNKAVYLMDGLPLLDNEFMLLKNDNGFSSPISVVFYEYYDTLERVNNELAIRAENIQCVVSSAGLPKEIPFGKAQHPELWDYADGIDTIDFLLKRL